jgi:hypothetical protein
MLASKDSCRNADMHMRELELTADAFRKKHHAREEHARAEP